MSFIEPTSLLLLILAPAAIVFFIWRKRVADGRWLLLGDTSLLSVLMPKANHTRRIWKSGLWILVIVFLIVALARPVWGEEVRIIETQGISIMVVLDVSRSMNAQDVAPSRLERAKLAIADLFDGLAGYELGMILFAGSAFVNFPLTFDTASANTYLQAVNTDAISRQGTDVRGALRLALDSFRSTNNSQRVIILITDGENHEGDPLAVASLAAEQGVIIHTIGYGSPDGAAIPIRDANGNEVGYHNDRAGNLVLSALNETTLREIAERTGGEYQRASSNGAEIFNLVATINQAETGDLGSRTEVRGVERFGIFVALALAALSLEILLPDIKRDNP